MRATLLDPEGTVILSRSFERSEPIASNDADELVRAWSTALGSIRDMLSDLASRQPPG